MLQERHRCTEDWKSTESVRDAENGLKTLKFMDDLYWDYIGIWCIYIYIIYICVCVSYNIYKYHLEWMYIYSFFWGDIIYNCYTGYTSDFIWIMWPHVVRSLAWWWMDSRNTLGPLGLCCFILTIFRLVTYFNSASGNGSWESANTCDPRN